MNIDEILIEELIDLPFIEIHKIYNSPHNDLLTLLNEYESKQLW